MGKVYKVNLWTRWKGYSGWKQMGILTLFGAGLAVGFICGYVKGSSDMAQLVLNIAERAIDSANVSINLSDIAKGYLYKAGVR